MCTDYSADLILTSMLAKPAKCYVTNVRSDVDKLRSQLKEEVEAPYIQQIREYESKAEKANQSYMKLRRELQSTKDESERALEKAKKAHEQEREEYEQQMAELKEQLARLQEQIDSGDGKSSSSRLQASLNNARSNVQRLTNELKEVRAAKERLAVSRINTEAGASKERNHVCRMLSEIPNCFPLQDSSLTLRFFCSLQLKQERDAAFADAEASRKRLENLQNEVARAREEIQKLNRSLASSESARLDAETKLQDEQQRRQTEQNAANNRLKRLNRDWEDERTRLQKQLEERDRFGRLVFLAYIHVLLKANVLSSYDISRSTIAQKEEAHRGELQRSVEHATRSYSEALQSRDATLRELRQSLRYSQEERSRAESER